MLSGTKLILILLIVLVVFGAGRLPKVMGDLGRGIRNFKSGMDGKEDQAALEKKDADNDQPKNS